MDALTAWLATSPLPWLVLTMLAYTFTLAVYRRSGAHPLLIPPLTATALVVAVLLLTGTPYATYREGVGLLSFLIGPATVALAVPLFAQRERIRQLWRPIGVALLVGGTVAIVSALLIAWALGGTRETLMALAPKSATMPIALPVAERMGGPASLAAVAVAITGIAGAVLAAPLMRLLRVHDPAVRGFAIRHAGGVHGLRLTPHLPGDGCHIPRQHTVPVLFPLRRLASRILHN